MATLNGTNTNNPLTGGPDNDSLYGLDGDDTLNGGAGDDLLDGGPGNDRFRPWLGVDSILGGLQTGLPWGTAGVDRDVLDFMQSGWDGQLIMDLGSGVYQLNDAEFVEVASGSYQGIEEVWGGRNTTDLISGTTSTGPADVQTGGTGVHLILNGGFDTVDNSFGYGVQQPTALGPSVYYHWSRTPIDLLYVQNTASVTYTASGLLQTEGYDILIGVGRIGDSRFNDLFDLSLATTNHLGYATETAPAPGTGRSRHILLMGYGGSDTVIGNGITELDFGVVSSSTAAGLSIDLTQGSATHSHLSTTATIGTQTNSAGLGTLTYSGIAGLYGTRFDDTLLGSAAAVTETFSGRGGNDAIDGRGGLDRADYQDADEGISLVLASGTLTSASQGTDTLRSIEIITGSGFNDSFDARGFVTGSSTTANAGSASGHFNAFEDTGGNDQIHGNGATQVSYRAAMVAVQADLASGIVDARLTEDLTSPLYATLGRDTLSGVFELHGSAQDDLLQGGGAGANLGDWPVAQAYERFRGGAGNDTIDGRGGLDFVDYRDSPDYIYLDLSQPVQVMADGFSFGDTLIDVEGVIGTVFNDIVTGPLDGQMGFIMAGGAGEDTLDGGNGLGLIAHHLDPGAVKVDLAGWVSPSDLLPETYEGSALDGWGSIDILRGVRDVVGSAFNDTIAGSSAGNQLVGGAGDDQFTGRGGNDTVNGGAGEDLAIFSGLKSQYRIGQRADGSLMVTDQVADRDGVDVLTSVEQLRFLDYEGAPELTSVLAQGRVYHWKSHMLLSGVEAGTMSNHANAADSSLFDLRAAAFDAATGTLTVQVWSTPSGTSTHFDFNVSSLGASSVSFTSTLGTSWSVVANTTNPGAVSVSGLDGSLSGLTAPTQLGTLTVQYPVGTSATSALFSQVRVGAQTAADLSLSAMAQVTGSDGGLSLSFEGAGIAPIKVSRGASDAGTAINSADALAALRIAVGINPNPDPDGAGPLQALRVSPFQFIAADVNGSGTVTAADALAILRIAVKLPSALPKEWVFVEENRDFWNEATQQFTLTRSSTAWDRSVVIDTSNTSVLGVVGLLKGDVNGSWSAPAGSTDLDVLDPNYFSNLATQLGVPTDQWGV